MTELVPCPGCARHVHHEDLACPFCGAAIDARPRPRASVTRGATRAAIFYLGASMAGAGCHATTNGGPPEPAPHETITLPDDPPGDESAPERPSEQPPATEQPPAPAPAPATEQPAAPAPAPAAAYGGPPMPLGPRRP